MASLAKVISKLPKKKGVKAYHSSPHDFDKFEWSPRTSMTGEGAQAYGAGLYFAESPKVSGRGGDYWRQFFNKMKSGPERTAAGAMFSNRFDPEEAIGVLERGTKYHSDRSIPGRYAEGPDVELGHSLLADESQQALEMLRSGKIVGPRTYEVNIDADPNTFLDWDKPLSEQSEAIKNAFRSINIADESVWPNITASDAYEMLRVDSMGDDAFLRDQAYRLARRSDAGAGASGMLRKTGIPGIKFLDAGSRGMNPPQVKPNNGNYEVYWGNDPRPVNTFPTQAAADAAAREIDGRTRNYVVFDDKLISIVRKYGIAGASAMLGYNILDGMSNAQAAELQKQAYPTDSKNTNTKSLANFLKDRGAAATQGASTMFDGETGRDKNIPDQLADIGTQAVAGINRGVASLPGLPKDLAGLADWGLDAFGVSDNETLRNVINPGRMWPISGEDSIKAWESVAGDLPEAETDLGAVTDFLAQFATPGPGELGGVAGAAALAMPAAKKVIRLEDVAKELGVAPVDLANTYSSLKYGNRRGPNDTPPEEWTKTVIEQPHAPLQKRKLEDYLGMTFTMTPADTATIDHVAGINGKDLASTVSPSGGPRYNLTPENADKAWAAAPVMAQKEINRMKRLEDAGHTPVTAATTMRVDGVDYNASMSDIILQRLQEGGLTKKEMTELNDFLITGLHRDLEGDFRPELFPGIESEKAIEASRKYLLNSSPGSQGKVRAMMPKVLDARLGRKLGAPEIGPIRFAVTDDEFAMQPSQNVGTSLFQIDPNGSPLPSDHGTYAAALPKKPGGTSGRLENLVPGGIFFDDWAKKKGIKLNANNQMSNVKSFNMSGVTQKITPQFLDKMWKLGYR